MLNIFLVNNPSSNILAGNAAQRPARCNHALWLYAHCAHCAHWTLRSAVPAYQGTPLLCMTNKIDFSLKEPMIDPEAKTIISL